jgi:hypothetical protein
MYVQEPRFARRSRKHIQFVCRALTTAAISLLLVTSSQALMCKGDPHTGACAWGGPGICSPVEVGGGQSGKCTTSGRPGELVCQCVGTPERPPPSFKPWDVVSSNDGVDDNGFLRNPVWNWQKQGGHCKPLAMGPVLVGVVQRLGMNPHTVRASLFMTIGLVPGWTPSHPKAT